MPRKTLPYKEGDWFAIPLAAGIYAIGIAARVSKGGAVLGYFFGTTQQTVPTVEDTQNLTASDAVLVAIFGDLGLLEGEWPIIHEPEGWQRSEWPMPEFGRIDSVNPSIAYRTAYNEDRLTEAVREMRVNPAEVQYLPKDGLYGYSALAKRLQRLLS